MDVVVFSVGASDAEARSNVYAGGYLDEREISKLRDDGVVGDVATVFHRIDGSGADLALNARATGPSFDDLRQVPRRVCVVADTGKTQALQGASAAGLITELVIDEATARELLDSVGSTALRRP